MAGAKGKEVHCVMSLGLPDPANLAKVSSRPTQKLSRPLRQPSGSLSQNTASWTWTRQWSLSSPYKEQPCSYQSCPHSWFLLQVPVVPLSLPSWLPTSCRYMREADSIEIMGTGLLSLEGTKNSDLASSGPVAAENAPPP